MSKDLVIYPKLSLQIAIFIFIQMIKDLSIFLYFYIMRW